MEIHDATPIDVETDLNNTPEQAVPSGLKNRDFNLKTAQLIRSQIGDIEEIRNSLGLSRRKMCQLLLIDPSTWTRWTTGKTTPPPYIYRMLQWGLAIMDKYPETHPLANYEKFEQLKKIEELEKKIEQLAETEVVALNIENLREKTGNRFKNYPLPLSILVLALVVALKF